MRNIFHNDYLLFTAVKLARFMLKMEITDTYRLLTYLVEVIRRSSNCMTCMAAFACKLCIPPDRYGKEIHGSKTLIKRIAKYFSACLLRKP